MKAVNFSPASREDLRAIALYIAYDNTDRAESFVAELEAHTARIAERPLSFPAKDEISKGLRGAIYGRYIILFRDLADEVRIVRVLHGARDMQRLAASGDFQ